MIHNINTYLIKKILLMVLSTAIVYLSSFAQNKKIIDSLLNVLKIADADTNKVNNLITLCTRCRQEKNFEESIKSGKEAVVLAEKLNFKKGMVNAYNQVAATYDAQYNLIESVKNFEAALHIRQELGDKAGMAVSYNNIASVYRKYGNSPEAIRNLFASLKIREEMGADQRGIAGMYFNISVIYGNMGNYTEAIKNQLASLKIREKINDKKGMASSLDNIASFYSLAGDNQETLKNYQAALSIKEEIGDKRGIAGSYIYLGNVYKGPQMNKYPEALKYYFDAIKIFEELSDRSATIDVYFNIGFLHRAQGNYSEATKNFLIALKISEETGNKSGVAATYGNIGDIYYEQALAESEPLQRKKLLNEALNNYLKASEQYIKLDIKNNMAVSYTAIGKVYTQLNKYPEAKQYLINSLSLAKEIESKELIKNTYYYLVELDSAMGDYRQAFLHYKLYSDSQDSLFNENSTREIAQIKAQYESEKKDIEIAQIKEQYESEKKDKEILQLTSDKQKLESEKQISALLLKSKQDSLSIVQAENDKVQLEYEKINTLNLYNQQQLKLLSNEKHLQSLQIDKEKADYTVQKAEADNKLLNKESVIQSLQLKKQKQAKYYFIAGFVLFAVLSFFIYRSYQTRQRLKLLTLRNKIASDLHDDVGSTLSSISIFSQLAQQQSKETIPMLETIGDSSRKMLDAMADIVWTINPENDQFEKIIVRMKSFAFELLGAKNIDFEFVAGDDVSEMKLSMDVRRNLYLIFKEATNNIVKYSEANKALFAIKEEKNNLLMMIQDNGKGFDVNKPTGGNGLKNMKKRAIEIGADLLIDSHPGNGTRIQLKVAV